MISSKDMRETANEIRRSNQKKKEEESRKAKEEEETKRLAEIQSKKERLVPHIEKQIEEAAKQGEFSYIYDTFLDWLPEEVEKLLFEHFKDFQPRRDTFFVTVVANYETGTSEDYLHKCYRFIW